MAANGHDTPTSEVNTKTEAMHLEKSLYNAMDLDAQIEQVTRAQHKKIFRKVDLRLMPMLMALYLVANLDRANIGNAKIEGLEADLNMTGTDYNVANMIFFVPYIL